MRVTVSIVFTDLVGSTEVASRLGADAAEQLRQTQFSLLREAVAAHDGTEVKNLGDGLMVVFPSVGAALRGAVAMQQGIDHHNRRGGEPLAVRVGVSSGDANEEDGDYFGPPVVEASRLCAAAGGGQILTTEVVRMLSGRDAGPFVPVGELELKGIPEPVAAVEVTWTPGAPESTVPLPARLTAPAPLGFVGRSDELDVLAGHLKAVAAGAGRRVTLLAGEPGIGKTALAAELARLARTQGATVLYGRCDEELGLPYQPFAEALGHYVAHAPYDALAAHVAIHGGELARLVPGLARRLADAPPPRTTGPDAERVALFAAVAALVADAAADEVVVLVLDDLQWAAKPTLLLLRHLVAWGEPMRLLVLGAYRDSDLAANHPLVDTLATLRREHAVERLALAGLGDIEVVALMEAAAGHELDAAAVGLAHALRRETDGNPFFVAELLRHLAAAGAVVEGDDGRWVGTADLETTGLPESVREVVGQRVRRLGEDAHHALTSAAVIGREFDLDLLARVLDRDEDELLDALDDAAASAVVTEVPERPGRFTFAHALIRHTLYDDLHPTRRQRVHRRVAEALEALCGVDPGERVGELARHFLAATQPADVGKALDYARRAGERAVAQLAPDEAVRWFGQALHLLPGLPRADRTLRCELLIGLGDAQRQAGDPAHRQTLLDAAALARALAATDLLVRAALANNRGMFSVAGRVDAERVAVLEAGLTAVGDTESPERARLLATLAAELTFAGDWERRRALADEAVALARRLGDPMVLAHVLGRTFMAVTVPETLAERLAASGEALALADRLADPVLRFHACGHRLWACLEAARLDEVDRRLDEMAELARRLGQPYFRYVVSLHRAFRAVRTGEHGDTDEFADEILRAGEEAGLSEEAFPAWGAIVLSTRRRQGRLGEMVELAEQYESQLPAIGAARATLAVMYCELGRLDDARARLETEAATGFDLPRDLVWMAATIMWALVSAELGAVGPAALLYARLAPFHGHLVGCDRAAAEGLVAHHLGRLATTLGRHADAEAHFAEAAALYERIEAPFWLGLNRLEEARLRHTRGEPGDAEQARVLLEQVRAAAAEHGFPTLDRRAAALQERLG